MVWIYLFEIDLLSLKQSVLVCLIYIGIQRSYSLVFEQMAANLKSGGWLNNLT